MIKLPLNKITKAYVEPEITEPIDLCDAEGRLNREAIGWSRVPLHRCNLKRGWPRRKKWNYWCVTTDYFAFSFTVADVDIIGLAFAYFFDYEKKEMLEIAVATPFGARCDMPEEVERSVSFAHRRMTFSINHRDGGIDVDFKCPSMNGKKVTAELTIGKPAGHETLNVVIPWSNERFQYTSKQNTLPTEGSMVVGDRTYNFEKDKAWAVLDLGRGLWPYYTRWNWGSFSGKQGDDIIGINIGGKWTDGTGTNENGICYNGKLYKVSEDLLWEYNTSNFMEPWHIKTEYSDMVDLTFTPFYDKSQKMNAIILGNQTHQCFGHYSGNLKVEGKTIEVKNLVGWAEEVISRW